jgi:hypothetical protein
MTKARAKSLPVTVYQQFPYKLFGKPTRRVLAGKYGIWLTVQMDRMTEGTVLEPACKIVLQDAAPKGAG